MRRTTTIWFILALLLGVMSTTQARIFRNLELSSSQASQILGVRLTDLAKYTSSIPNLSQEEANDFEDKINRYLPEEYELDKTLNLFVNDFPKITDKGILIPVTAFGPLEENGEYVFLQLIAYFDGENFTVEPKRIIPLSNTLFNLKVSLANRKLILKDSMNPTLSMVFPLGVGSFDEGVLNDAVTLLTPRFENAFLDQRAVISERKKPRYFAGKPFLRITTSESLGPGHTAIGFHVQPNMDTFVRAFDSHGCMRMQLNDLYFLHDLIKEGPHQRLSIDVKFHTDETLEHPFPKRNKPYKRVLNAGSKEEPRWAIDRDGLVQTTKDWDNSAPVDQLQDITGDTHHALFDYEMAWRKAERLENLKKSCLEENNYTEEDLSRRQRRKREKAYEKCVKSGKPRRTLRDRVYRWWVH
jgi:hypothetical protein